MAFTAVVPPNVKKERLAICESCKWFKPSTRSCGTLIIAGLKGSVGEVEGQIIKDNRVTYYKKKVVLCGCNMDAKTEFTWAQCPAEKWLRYGIDKRELVELRRISLELRKTGKLELGSEKHIRFQTYLRKLTGRNVEVKACPSCINELLELSLSATAEVNDELEQ